MGHSLSEVTRSGKRIYVALPVTLRAGSEAEGGVVVHGNTVDYSERGLRVRSNLPIRIGQNVEVFVSRNGDQPKKYCVTWVHDPVQGKPCYEVGLVLEQ